MAKRKQGLFDYLDETSIAILRLLKNDRKRHSELQKKSPVSPGAFSTRINQLIELRLVKVEYDQEERRPFYVLTNTGKRILELLEEIERVYKSKVDKKE
jgi:DNA-binding HxlR family transcriptional regulator